MVRRSWLVVAILALTPLAAGCSGSDEPTSPASTAPTSIDRITAGAVHLARAEFCDRVPASAVRRALGTDPLSDESWANGDPVPGAEGTGSGDVGHEIGCGWAAAGSAAARAWVFARPVDAGLAAQVVSAAGRSRGCTAEETSVFGSPALLQQCTLAGGLVRERRAGLFGDTWLSCELTSTGSTSDTERRTRLDGWCATVVAALDTGS